MMKSDIRIASFVPSWTETLLMSSADVVGRTRFCIHPGEKVKKIPVLGGTKSLNLDTIQKVNPQVIILDKQENTLEMAIQLTKAGYKLIITDVVDFASLISALKELSEVLHNPFFAGLAKRYDNLKPMDRKKFFKNLVKLGDYKVLEKDFNFEYVIWKDPFMVVGKDTFIAENLSRVNIILKHIEKYPKLSQQELKQAVCLFSSEPYPFHLQFEELIQEGFKGVVVDGEKLSWFGIRNLIFLEASQVLIP